MKNKEKFNLTEFISSVNKYSIIGEYDQIIKYASNTDTYENINTSIYIKEFLDSILYYIE